MKIQATSTNFKLQKENISRKECNTIDELKNNYNIVIKEADKGSAIIIMNSSYYKNKIFEQLQIDRNMALNVMNKIDEFSKKYKTVLKDKKKNYICKFDTGAVNSMGCLRFINRS